MFAPYASEIWTKPYGRNYTKFWTFWQKNAFLKTIFEDGFVAETIG